MEHTNQSPCKLHQQRGPIFLIKKSSATGRPKKNGPREVGLLRVSPCSNCISKGPTQKPQKAHKQFLCLHQGGPKKKQRKQGSKEE